MAIWQLNFILIPKNEGEYQKETLLCDRSLSVLSTSLPVNTSWCAEDILFGSLDSTCVEISFHNAEIDEIAVRLDIQTLSKDQVHCIIQFAISNNLQMLYNGRRMDVSKKNLCNIIQESDALCFLKNPEEFLANLS